MRFEWVKLSKNIKNLVLFLLLFLALIVSFANRSTRVEKANETDFKQLKSLADEIQPPQGYTGPHDPYKMLHHFDEEMEYLSEKEEAQFHLVSEILYLLEDENTARNQKNWEEQLNIQTKRLRLQKEYTENGGADWLSISKEDIDKNLSRNQLLKKNNLPITDLTASQKGIYFIYSLLLEMTAVGGMIIILLLLFFDFLSSEYEQGTENFMFVQPLDRRRFYWQKCLTAFLVFSGLLFFLLMIGFLLGFLFSGSGSWQYPIYEEVKTGYHFIPLWQSFLKNLGLQMLFGLLILQVIMLLSYWLKNGLEVLGVGLLVLLLPNVIEGAFPAIRTISIWLPIFYMNSQDKLTTVSSVNPFSTGLLVLSAGNGLMVWLAHKGVRR